MLALRQLSLASVEALSGAFGFSCCQADKSHYQFSRVANVAVGVKQHSFYR